MAAHESGLPYIVSELAEVVGEGRLLAFLREHGGRRLSVPRAGRLTDDHLLVQALGRAGAERLCALYAGEWILIPMGPAGTLAEARRRAARALLAGAPVDEAAGAGGLHRRTVQRMRRRLKDDLKDDGSQGSLF